MVLNIQLGDIGLVLDLLGAVLLFFFGLAPLLSKDGSMSLSVGSSEYLKRKARKYEILSRLGALLIAIGFAFQLAGNHITNYYEINFVTAVVLLTIGLLLSLLIWFLYSYFKRRYDFRAQYVPQFDINKPSHSGDHMWSFRLTNNTRRIIESATIHLSGKPSKVQVIIQGEKPATIEPNQKIKIEDVLPGKSIIVRAWNIAGYKEAGLDCYLIVESKTIRPKVYHFDEL